MSEFSSGPKGPQDAATVAREIVFNYLGFQITPKGYDPENKLTASIQAALESYAESVIKARMPTEEEIAQAANDPTCGYDSHEEAFGCGAKWLRSRLERK